LCPLLHPHFFYLAQIRQNLGMMQHSVVVEAGDFGAGKFIAIGTARDIWLAFSARSQIAFLTK
jgi:hypothetical protein